MNRWVNEVLESNITTCVTDQDDPLHRKQEIFGGEYPMAIMKSDLHAEKNNKQRSAQLVHLNQKCILNIQQY